MKKSILFSAPIKTRSGYGEHARDLAYAMLLEGGNDYNLQIHPTNWGNTPWTGLDLSTEKGKLISSAIIHTLPPTPPDIFIQLTIPNEFSPIGKYNIGITAGIETDLCAPNWIEGCNSMDMVITTSKHSLKVFQESKFDVHDNVTSKLIKTLELRPDLKTEILFEGLDLSTFKKGLSEDERGSELYKDLSSIKEDFAFLFVGHWLNGPIGHDRKDVGMLIDTYLKAFVNTPASNRPALVLKTSKGSFGIPDRYEILNRINSISGKIKNAPNIYLLHGDLSDSDMNTLYNHPKIKAMVSFTKGEGFGRPLLEFGVTGKPIIASNWSGHLDFLKPDSSILLPGRLDLVHPESSNEWILKESKWFTVDYNYAKKVFQSVHDQYKDYYKTCSSQSSFVKDNFSFNIMARKLKSILDSISVPVQVSLIMPHSEKESTQSPLSLKLPKLKKIE